MDLRKCFGLFVLVCMVMVLGGCGLFKTKIDLSEFVTWSYEGISGYTTIVANIDKDGIRNNFGGEIDAKKSESFNVLVDSLEISLSKCENLVNGDVVILTVNYNKELCDGAGVKFAGDNLEITIEGLREGELLDLFADINVNVTGIAPFATASIENKSANTFLQGLNYSLNVTSGFRAGDVLTVTCAVTDEEAGNAGYAVLKTVENFGTDGILYYVEKPEQINMQSLSLFAAEAENVVKAETESSTQRMLYKVTGNSNYLFQYNKEWVDSIALQEVRLLTLIDMNQSAAMGIPYNKVQLIYKAYVTNADHGSDGYFCFEYSDLVVQPDGTLTLKNDKPELRYMCNDDYTKLMVAVSERNNGLYSEQQVDITGLINMAAPEGETQGETQAVIQ